MSDIHGTLEAIYNCISKGYQCVLMVITLMAVWHLLYLGRRMYAYSVFQRIAL